MPKIKALFINAERKLDNLKETEDLFRKFSKIVKSKKIDLFFSIQYKELAKALKEFLIKKHRKITAFKQILGCSNIKAKNTVVFVGSGRFHAVQLAVSSGKEVFIFPSMIKISEKDIEKINKVKKTVLKKPA